MVTITPYLSMFDECNGCGCTPSKSCLDIEIEKVELAWQHNTYYSTCEEDCVLQV